MMSNKKLAAGAAIFVAAAAAGVFLSYGSVSPCGVLHSQTRAILTEAAVNSGHLAVLIVNNLPIEGLIDAKLTERLGAAGPLQCAFVLWRGDWSGLRESVGLKQ